MSHLPKLFALSFMLVCCTTSKLEVIADLPHNLNEVSAIETTTQSELLWVIEDSGNKNNLYGLDGLGNIIKNIDLKPYGNVDWEDLTSDKEGNIYIGDFGNNSKKRKEFTILKVKAPHKIENNPEIESIQFRLPKDMKSQDFEAFFLSDGLFYIFSKAYGKCYLITVPNSPGKHTATLKKEFKLDSKRNRITSADISDDGQTVVLLNHDKVWKLTDYIDDNFFDGERKQLKFHHLSQKEGVCFKSKNQLLITDERGRSRDSNIYLFNMDTN